MLEKILLAIVQAATEFLPISSSGHLALITHESSSPNLFFFTVLHLASLVAVLIFTKKEIIALLKFNGQYAKLWLYLIIASIPAILFGFFCRGIIEQAFSSLLFIGFAYLFTGGILFLSKASKARSRLSIKNSIIIGLFQMLALFPGISRSGVTVSSALFLGIERDKAVKFSFLLFIPLSIGAFALESKQRFYFDLATVVSFFICLGLSLCFLNLLFFMVKKGKLWMFSVYCFLIGALSLILHFNKIP